MDPSIERHLQDDDVEQYSMGLLPEEKLPQLEEHLLICAACRDRVEEHDSYLKAIRGAAVAARAAGEPQRLWIMRPVWLAAAASVLFASVLLVRTGSHSVEPQAVRLEAMRGIGIKASADTPLVLQPDLKSLPPYASYRLEVVNEVGGRVFGANITAGKPQATMPGVPKGMYFVRLYAPSGDVLREYGVDTR